MNDTALDNELVVLEDIEFERPCTPWKVDCGAKADWVLHVWCCTAEIPLCDPHMRIIEDIYRNEKIGDLILCASCKATFVMTHESWWWEKL